MPIDLTAAQFYDVTLKCLVMAAVYVLAAKYCRRSIAAATAAMKARILAGLLIPGRLSTPDDTSTRDAPEAAKAAATLVRDKPPARPHRSGPA